MPPHTQPPPPPPRGRPPPSGKVPAGPHPLPAWPTPPSWRQGLAGRKENLKSNSCLGASASHGLPSPHPGALLAAQSSPHFCFPSGTFQPQPAALLCPLQGGLPSLSDSRLPSCDLVTLHMPVTHRQVRWQQDTPREANLACVSLPPTPGALAHASFGHQMQKLCLERICPARPEERRLCPGTGPRFGEKTGPGTGPGTVGARPPG